MGPKNAFKDMLDNVVSPITCVSMNHQNQLEQMSNGAMFTTGEKPPPTHVPRFSVVPELHHRDEEDGRAGGWRKTAAPYWGSVGTGAPP
jgi:hypothetical protein